MQVQGLAKLSKPAIDVTFVGCNKKEWMSKHENPTKGKRVGQCELGTSNVGWHGNTLIISWISDFNQLNKNLSLKMTMFRC